MATTYRVRTNFIGGLIEDNPLLIGATTLTSNALGALGTLATDEYMVIVLDPDGLAGAPEIAYISAHSLGGTTATIIRGQEGSTARAHDRDKPWVHSATVWDIERPHVRCERITSTNSTATTVTFQWNSDQGDYWVMHDNSTNPDRITIVRSGWYLVETCVYVADNVSFAIRLLKNGATILSSSRFGNGTNEGATATWSGLLVAGDYLTVQNVTGSTVAMATTATDGSHFSATMIDFARQA